MHGRVFGVGAIVGILGCAPTETVDKAPPGVSAGSHSGGGGGGQSTDSGTGGSDTGTGSSTGGATGSGTTGSTGTGGGAQPYGNCMGGSCPSGEICLVGVQVQGAQICATPCTSVADCPAPPDGDTVPTCAPPEVGMDQICRLDCSGGQICPSGSVCNGFWCWYF